MRPSVCGTKSIAVTMAYQEDHRDPTCKRPPNRTQEDYRDQEDQEDYRDQEDQEAIVAARARTRARARATSKMSLTKSGYRPRIRVKTTDQIIDHGSGYRPRIRL